LTRQDKEDITGKVGIYLTKSKAIEHQGIRVDLIGMIENRFDKNQNFQFLNLTKELEPPGTLTQNATYDFDFKNLDMGYESYQGICVSLKYLIKITITRQYGSLYHEELFLVYNPEEKTPHEEPLASIKLEVGIEECLHI